MWASSSKTFLLIFPLSIVSSWAYALIRDDSDSGQKLNSIDSSNDNIQSIGDTDTYFIQEDGDFLKIVGGDAKEEEEITLHRQLLYPEVQRLINEWNQNQNYSVMKKVPQEEVTRIKRSPFGNYGKDTADKSSKGSTDSANKASKSGTSTGSDSAKKGSDTGGDSAKDSTGTGDKASKGSTDSADKASKGSTDSADKASKSGTDSADKSSKSGTDSADKASKDSKDSADKASDDSKDSADKASDDSKDKAKDKEDKGKDEADDKKDEEKGQGKKGLIRIGLALLRVGAEKEKNGLRK